LHLFTELAPGHDKLFAARFVANRLDCSSGIFEKMVKKVFNELAQIQFTNITYHGNILNIWNSKIKIIGIKVTKNGKGLNTRASLFRFVW